ncbi:SusD/RagB family nutrient-binding outer membrane lipoprotein [Flavobacterium sedimenticola]|uniref:SusD/RagB family nutrient-binding outer membrane lipoprotein n=1 Tax=Flavobacterium sedimenticola TaxID=3043286 RepID=A0ABT6XSH7_9FLAO|nr:SusD/RagB family nutrient-binding outer membrane lipoprotein [Flavobacterium sedimenticola]MDI9258054.1 SusD/RagB family nutrient-binding outer membrane lipoprotein [Flavobacterium sedimenticola]
MKKIFLLIATLSMFSSCSDEDFDINRDPDNLSPGSISLKTQLPAGIVGVAGAQGSYYALVGGFWSQYWTQSNSANQYKEVDDYSIGTDDYTGGWTAMYDALGDIRNVKRLAANQENWNYYLIATTMEVHASQIMADMYDQIPYTEANNVNILTPHFNTGQEVYDLLASDLQDALSKDLSTSSGDAPGTDDLIFGGNMSNWTAFANTLLLKVYMRQTEARPAIAQAGITALLNSGVTFLNTDAALGGFENAPSKSNPLYESDRRQLNVATNLRASTTLFSFFTENNDPRKAEYYNPGNPLNQGDFNSTVGSSSVSVVHLEPTTAVYFMSKEESLFLQAEALERYASGVGAKAKYDAGVVESFNKYGFGTTGSTFVASGGAYEYPAAGTFADKLKAIITQKWISGFPGNGFEMFFEHNRTGYPSVSPVPQSNSAYVPGTFAYSVNGTTGGQFPKRMVFPSTVTTRNPNAPSLVGVIQPVWWDVN